MRTIEVCVNPMLCPPAFDAHHDTWVADQLRNAGMPFVYRTLEQGPARGLLATTLLEGGSTLYRWTSEAAA